MTPEAQFEDICDELKVQMVPHLYEAVRVFAERLASSRPSLAASEVIPAYEGRTIGAGKRARLIALLDEWIKEADAASPEERAAEQANFEAIMESIGRRSPLSPPTPASGSSLMDV